MSTINRNRLMHKVAPVLRLDKSSRDLFDPLVVSIGPYHHGKPELQLVEELKKSAVHLFVEGSNNKDREFYFNKIMETINDVRSCYVEGSTDEYEDEDLANMMLQDACFILKYGEMLKDQATIYQVGRFLFEYIWLDVVLLENQLPFSILKLLDYSTGDGNDGTLLDNFISTNLGSEWNLLKLLELGHNDEPIHFLELSRRRLDPEDKPKEDKSPEDKPILGDSKSCQSTLVAWVIPISDTLLCKSKKTDNSGDGEYAFRSATDLKTRGVHFNVGPSGYYRLKDIKFKSTYFYGELQLPKWNVNIFTKVYLSNILALENYLSEDECFVTAYVNIMKILLQSTKDVRELREKHVLVNDLRTDEDLLRVFLDLPVTTWDPLRIPPFSDVMEKVENYSGKLANKYAAELIQTYFRSPWTTMALFAAALLLCLTIIQVHFAVHPAKS